MNGKISLSSARGGTNTARAVESLADTTRVRSTGISSYGSVANAPGFKGNLGLPSSVTVTMDNSGGGAALQYVIGDQMGLIAANLNGAVAYTQPTSSSTGSVAAMQASFGFAPITVLGIVYNATSGATQFPQRFRYAKSDIDGGILAKPVNTPEFQRPTNFNANQLVLEFANQFVLDEKSAFVLTVAAGQLVSLTLMVGAASYR